MNATKDTNLVELGKKIKALRRGRKFTQEELSYQAQIDNSSLQRIERGVYNPSYLTLLKIAAALDITVLEIFLIE